MQKTDPKKLKLRRAQGRQKPGTQAEVAAPSVALGQVAGHSVYPAVKLCRKRNGQASLVAETDRNVLSCFGFTFTGGAVHLRRTMMFDDLTRLLLFVEGAGAKLQDYRHAIKDENCLGKRSRAARAETFRSLVLLYSLSPSFVLFRALRYFWQRESAVSGRALLAMQCALVRDPVLRSATPFIRKLREGEVASRQALAIFINRLDPGRFSTATLSSAASNIFCTWTKAGYLSEKNPKVRAHAHVTAANVSYALLLGYLLGARGEMLFATDFMELQDCSLDEAVELAAVASQKGWLVFKRVGNIMEVLFPSLINAEEMEWLR